MAQSGNTTRRRSGSSSKRSSGSSSNRRTNTRSSKKTSSSTFADYFHAFSKTRFFAPVVTVFVITFTILLDLLISWNNFDRFFKILGFALLIVGIIWIIGLVLSFGESSSESHNS